MRDTNDLALAHRPEISAVERIRMRLHHEKLPLEKSEAPLPDRQRTAVLVSLEGLGDGLAVGENNTAGPANSIAADASNPLEKRDDGRQNGVSDEQGFEGVGRANG